MTPRSTFRRLVQDRLGVATVEFAYALPLLLVCVSGLANVTHRIAAQSQLESASSAGARYAARSGYDQVKIAAAVEGDQPQSSIKASPAPALVCRCITSHHRTSIDCSLKCSNGNDPAKYVVVSATVPYASPFPWLKINDDKSITFARWARVK